MKSLEIVLFGYFSKPLEGSVKLLGGQTEKQNEPAALKYSINTGVLRDRFILLNVVLWR